jgi:hypothetical protein
VFHAVACTEVGRAQLGLMHPEKFSDHAELHNYAERHGLEYLWEGTQAFERRKRTLPPEQFEICEARTHRGMRKVLLFSKDILVAEWLKTRSPAGQEQGLDCLARS